ncbi:MAG: oligoendopeptidase F [Calditrichia bacterium]
MIKKTNYFVIVLILLSFTFSLFAQYESRDQIPEKYRWNLQDLYESNDAWENHFNQVKDEISNFSAYKGKLNNPDELVKALETYYNIVRQMTKLYSYASMMKDENLADASKQLLSQKISSLWTKFGETTSFMVPELIKLGKEYLLNSLKEKEELQVYSMFIKDVIRQAEHTLSESEEALMAMSSEIMRTPSQVYGIFNNAEMPNPVFTLSTGEKVELTAPIFGKYRTTPNREDRKNLFSVWFNNYGKFKNTLAANLVGNAKGHHFVAKARKYSSSLEASLANNNIPVSVYENLIKQINESLPVLHRYVKLKAKMLQLDTLHYYDLYMPLTKNFDQKYTVDEAQKLLLKALKPMGKEYLQALKTSFEDRWIDYYPTKGKRSGAYSNGSAYDVHPYILMNYTDDYNSLSTLAHELGHTIHSYFSNKFQPYPTSDYSIFVAEIASTFNENLLNHYLVEKADNKELKLFLLSSYLERMRTTIFRQTLFAEFEWELHKMVEAGQPITGETLSELYLNLTRKYYGHDQGICIVDPEIAYEWAYIPHFYYNFYVYQYATSQIYSTAFAEKVFKDQSAVQDYFKILKGGSSKYPIDLIKDAGIDPLSSEAFELTMKRMNEIMDEIEKLLK